MSVYPTTRASRRAALATCSTAIAALAFTGVASANPSVTKLDGNPKCSDVSTGLHSVKIDPVRQGVTSFSGGQITVAGKVFDWTSSQPISVVIVKGGPNANIYRYDPAATSGDDLHAPVNPKNGQFYGLSHIDFCTGGTPPPPGECEPGGNGKKNDGTPCNPPGPCENGGPTTKPNGQPCAPKGPCEEGGPATHANGEPCSPPPPPGPCEDGGPTMRPDGTPCNTPQQEVGGVVENAGGPRVRASARLRTARRCVNGTYTQVLRGTGIRKVTVKVNGKAIGRMSKKGSRYTIRINTRSFKSRVLKVRARVTFVSASGRRPQTLRTTVLRCAGNAPAVQFTG